MTSLSSKYFGSEWRCQVSTVAEEEFLEPGSGQGPPRKGCSCFTKSLLRGSSFWNSIPLPAHGVHCSFILSPLFYTLGAPGRPWGLALPGPHIGIYGFQWWREPRLAGIVDTAFAEEQSHPGARDRSDEAGTRTQQHSGSQAPAEPQLNPTGPRGPP